MNDEVKRQDGNTTQQPNFLPVNNQQLLSRREYCTRCLFDDPTVIHFHQSPKPKPMSINNGMPEFPQDFLSSYPHDFQLLSDGTVQCLTAEGKPSYDFDKILCKEFIPSNSQNPILYLISTLDGQFKGKLIEEIF